MTAIDHGPHQEAEFDEQTRRDFLLVSTAIVGASGAALALWPFIDSLNPAADTLSLATTELDLAPIELGQRVTVVWRGKPVFIDHRPQERIARAERDDSADLPDPAPDSARVQRKEWLVVIGVCTHLGCIPLGQRPDSPRGDYGGWFCPCHGSHYDTAGRIRKGPAPRNLDLPPYSFLTDTKVRIG